MSAYHSIIRVAQTALTDEIKQAWRREVRKHHPDTGGDGILMLEIDVAWETLKEPDKKRAYDQTRKSSGGQRNTGPSTSYQRQPWSYQRQDTRSAASEAKALDHASKRIKKDTFRSICSY